jgi:hypothetical protein
MALKLLLTRLRPKSGRTLPPRAAAGAQARRETERAGESLRLQREAVELQRQQAQTDRIRQSNEMYRQLYRGR